jgi:hypothetical protein
MADASVSRTSTSEKKRLMKTCTTCAFTLICFLTAIPAASLACGGYGTSSFFDPELHHGRLVFHPVGVDRRRVAARTSPNVRVSNDSSNQTAAFAFPISFPEENNMRYVLAISAAVMISTVCISLASVKGLDTKKRSKKEPTTVKSLMLAAHKSTDDRPAPLRIVQDEVERKQPNWKLLVRNTKPLSKLAEAIKNKRFAYKGLGAPYVKHVAALALAAKTRDLPRARMAMSGIQKSCAACHYGR